MASITGHAARMVPDLLWEDLEDGLILLNDVFLGYTEPLSPATPQCVAFVDPEQDINNDGPYSKFNGNGTHYNSTATLLNDQNQHSDNKWFDDYVNLETFGSSSQSLPTNTGTHFPAQSNYESGTFYSNSFSGFPHSNNDHQMQDLSGPSSSGISAAQFSQLNIQEPSFGMDNLRPVPIPESDYSASYSRPGSAYSSDWSSSSAQSQDEILEEIQRECAEIERKSVSPPLRQKTYAKKRSGTVLNRSSTEHIASNSSTNSLSGLGGNSDRKKELNRIAATKYREKKRREKEMISTEHKHLESRNHQLRGTVKELKSEIGYLRKLMKDMEVRSRQ